MKFLSFCGSGLHQLKALPAKQVERFDKNQEISPNSFASRVYAFFRASFLSFARKDTD